jgi:CheY-like chemotaxis protein
MSETISDRDVRPQSHPTILVVEDDDDIRETTLAVLEDEGHTARGAANGREALEALARIEHPCLVLLDLMMPVMSGVEFLWYLRRDDALVRIPVIIVSAWPKEAEAISGVQGFVKKPVDVRVLLDLVERYCGSPGRDGA